MKIANPRPPFCSVCRQPPSVRDPQPDFVDFEVAYDGPVVTRHGDEVRPENYNPVSIDWLVICDECLSNAAKLIGMVNDEGAKARVEELEVEVSEQEKALASKDRAISHLERTVAEAIDHPVKRGHGKPTFKGPESHAEELAEMRKNRAAREKRGKAKREKAKA